MGVPVFKILLGATGSVAAIKVPLLIKTLLAQPISVTNCKFEIHLMITDAAKRFVKTEDIPAEVHVYDDDLAKKFWKRPGDPILHVELTNLADVMLLAPLSSKTMAKIAQGIADNLVSSTVRCWYFNKPLLFCPGMNPRMWSHPINDKHRNILKQWGYIEIPPVSKKVLCGTVGVGGLAEVDTIVDVVVKVANKNRKLTNA